MSEKITALGHYKSILVECGTGLYGAIGGLRLAIFGVSVCSAWLMAMPLVAQWLSAPVPRWALSSGPCVVAAILVAIWLDITLDGRKQAARLTAAIVLGIFIFHAGSRLGWWSREPMSWWSTPAAQSLLAAILAMLVLALLPNLRRRSPPLKPKSRSLRRVLLYLLPLVAMLPTWGLNIAMQAKMRPLGQRISQVQLPVPPEAQEVADEEGPVGKMVNFTLRERYPSTTVTKFYEQHLSAEGWHQDYQGGWKDTGGYSPREKRAKMSHLQSWVSPDGQLMCSLSIEYKAPGGTDPRLPLGKWEDEWLEVQHVQVLVMPRSFP